LDGQVAAVWEFTVTLGEAGHWALAL